MLIAAILKLHEKVQNMPLGANAREAIESNEGGALARVLP